MSNPDPSARPLALSPANRSLFHKTGLIYFWCLNDECSLALVDRYIEQFVSAGVAAVCLHPRAGLLLPYGGSDWFDFIRETAHRCARRGLQVWLYDEDPYPSGACGGWITSEHPEWVARAINMYQADPATCQDGLFGFPVGNLLWCGVVDQAGQLVEDLTDRVGMVRRQWSLLDPWDSRWYYPATPLYPCPRSKASGLEFAVRLPKLSDNQRLCAFVAQPTGGDGPWGALPDSLNPDCTREFLHRTHDRYAATVGNLFGREITAMFTDEPKYYGNRPWTRGMFEDFQQQFGYDLRPRLFHLFSQDNDDRSALTRLHYRQWCGQRFEQAWLAPVSQWCQDHNLALVGHISPEDDPIQQSACVTNLFPLQKYFTLSGLDLIIPAVGDRDHPLINLGVMMGVSTAQQQDKPGVMSETLGASGLDLDGKTARRILLWQAVMGVTTHVIHGGFNSVQGMRQYDAPPDSGPSSALWPDMIRIARELTDVQQIIRNSRQIAPVTVLWPIRSFNMQNLPWQHEPGGLRGELVDLLQMCLDRQVGTHLLDEQDLWLAKAVDGQLHVGAARYSHILIPSCLVLDARSVDMLKAAQQSGVRVTLAGQAPDRQQLPGQLRPLDMNWCPRLSPTQAVAQLPRLMAFDQDAADIRCTTWCRDGHTTSLLMNLRPSVFEAQAGHRSIRLEPAQVLAVHV